jgi:hypothetical protein
MNDHELDQLIARANPYGDDTVRRLPAGAAGGDVGVQAVGHQGRASSSIRSSLD